MKFSNAKRGGELIFQVWSGKKKGNQSLTDYDYIFIYLV